MFELMLADLAPLVGLEYPPRETRARARHRPA
jgi:hypothetical protein